MLHRLGSLTPAAVAAGLWIHACSVAESVLLQAFARTEAVATTVAAALSTFDATAVDEKEQQAYNEGVKIQLEQVIEEMEYDVEEIDIVG